MSLFAISSIAAFDGAHTKILFFSFVFLSFTFHNSYRNQISILIVHEQILSKSAQKIVLYVVTRMTCSKETYETIFFTERIWKLSQAYWCFCYTIKINDNEPSFIHTLQFEITMSYKLGLIVYFIFQLEKFDRHTLRAECFPIFANIGLFCKNLWRKIIKFDNLRKFFAEISPICSVLNPILHGG